MKIRVLLVDDHKIMREGLKSLLEQAEDIAVVAQASNGQEAVQCYSECLPDVVVMDLTMPVMGGIEATREILAVSPQASVLALSMVLDRSCVAESLKAGAKGYLLKDCAADELMVAIRALHAGKSYLCSSVTDLVINEFQKKEGAGAKALLSPREREVLQYLADGASTKEIAFQLQVSSKTVETVRANIMKKVGATSIAELIKYAIREGITSI
ncbi:response regulator transcription factor [Trichlorobacter lovleyi]|uniref:response regulator transcription factor n=1 Tax=Trichlorobacter lovleyi TaxID=313985 RepID=UPI0022402B4F|nr:response regulator transcription factor [Trichlorobacter lovleyi]QOX77809.1 response regulator transcription factor [Trichlorobacter lovleyi]